MPKQHPKQQRNCLNQTQERDPLDGRFVRRRDDYGDVKHTFDRPGEFRKANAAAKQRSALSSACRRSRNSQAAINAKNAR